MKKISMGKKYTYRNGEPAKILRIDNNDDRFPVVSMKIDGSTVNHTAFGLSTISTISLTGADDLVETVMGGKD